MKSVKYILFAAATLLLLPSCQDDNYDEPNSCIYGKFIDADTSEPVPMPVQGNGNSLKIRMFEKDRLYSQGADHSEMPIDFFAQWDGTYRNSFIFATEYMMVFEQANFYPVDSIDVTLKPGQETACDVRVTPYARVKIENAGIDDAKMLTVTYKVARSRDDYKIQSAFLAWHISPYIDDAAGNSMGKASTDFNATDDKQILGVEQTLSIDLQNDGNFNNTTNQSIMVGNGNKLYVRVGVVTNGKTNYSDTVEVGL